MKELSPPLRTVILLFLSLLSLPAHSARDQNPQGETWLRDGQPVNEANIKQKNGFGAMLQMFSNQEFFEQWDNSETPNMVQIDEAHRGKPVFAVIIFLNPGTDEKGHCNVRIDLNVYKPSGDLYGGFDDANGWDDNHEALPKGILMLAVPNLGIRIEDDDPAGKYHVQAVVRDKIKGVEHTLDYYFTVD